MAGIEILLMVLTVVCSEASPPPTTTPITTPLPDARQVVAKIVKERIESPNYNPRVRPGKDGGPLDVYININVHDICHISETQMEYTITLFLLQHWKDERLAYNDTGYNRDITLNYKWFEQIWTPDLYIDNLKSGHFHEITVPNRRIRLSPHGLVHYSERLTVTLYCDMMLERFPMDNQTCFIEFGSYAYTTDELIFHWRMDDEAVTMSRITLPQYTITNITNSVCTPSTSAAYACLRAYFHLSRRLKMYILNIYLPSFLLVLLSWLSFYIDPTSAPARVSLGITTILAIITQNSGMMNSMPSASITKASDVWMATCLVFIFGAFIEYATVNNLTRRRKKRKVEDVSHKANGGEGVDGSVDEKSSCGRRGGYWPLFDFKEDPAMTVERVSRILFPFAFFIFCLIYWPIYLIG